MLRLTTGFEISVDIEIIPHDSLLESSLHSVISVSFIFSGTIDSSYNKLNEI